MGASRKAALKPDVPRGKKSEGAGVETTAPAPTRCEAVLKNGDRCKRDGKSIFDGRSGRSLFYCFVHRKLLRANGRLTRRFPQRALRQPGPPP